MPISPPLGMFLLKCCKVTGSGLKRIFFLCFFLSATAAVLSVLKLPQEALLCSSGSNSSSSSRMARRDDDISADDTPSAHCRSALAPRAHSHVAHVAQAAAESAFCSGQTCIRFSDAAHPRGVTLIFLPL